MRLIAFVAVLALLAVPAFAGNDNPRDAHDGLCSGFSCENMCPLAHEANAWRAAGSETFAVASRMQKDHAAVVVKNLGKI